MEECWKRINLESKLNYYEVSNNGRVRSVHKKSGKTKIRKSHPNNRGYHCLLITYGTERVTNILVHRIVAKYFIDNPLGLDIVNHLDFDKNNNNASNLEWCTQKENVRHAIDNFRFGKSGGSLGIHNNNAKLTEDDVRSIRLSEKSSLELSKKFNVTKCTINSVLRRDSWRHI